MEESVRRKGRDAGATRTLERAFERRQPAGQLLIARFEHVLHERIVAAAEEQVALINFKTMINEIVAAADQDAVAGQNFNAQIVETVLGLDAVSAAYLWNPVDDNQDPNWQNLNDAQTPGWGDINDAQSPNWTSIQTVN